MIAARAALLAALLLATPAARAQPSDASDVAPALRGGVMAYRAGDLTTDAIVPAAARGEAALVARQAGIIAGLDLASLAFRLLDPAIEIRVARSDGTPVAPGDLANALGADQISGLMAQTCLSRDELLSGLSEQLPRVVDHLTPDGRLPTEQEMSRLI